MNQQNLTKWLYTAAMLLLIAGAAVHFLHTATGDLGLNLILAGHLFILAAIFLQMKQIKDAAGENNLLQKHSERYENH